MELTKNICTGLLILVSLSVLAIDYQFITGSELSIGFGGISLSGIKATNDLLFPVLALSLVLGFGLCHVLHVRSEIADNYCAGYRESPAFKALIRDEVAAAIGSDRYGSPYGGLRPSLIKKSFIIGPFATPDNTQSDPVVIYPETTIHLKGLAYGLYRAISPKLWLSVYAPLLFGIWALCVIAV